MSESKKCIVMDCTNCSDEGEFVGDLCYPCHNFVTSGKGVHSQAYRNARRVSTRKMVLDLEFLPKDDTKREELNCMFCKMKDCDHVISLWRWCNTPQRIGVHDTCLDRHEAIRAKQASWEARRT